MQIGSLISKVRFHYRQRLNFYEWTKMYGIEDILTKHVQIWDLKNSALSSSSVESSFRRQKSLASILVIGRHLELKYFKTYITNDT